MSYAFSHTIEFPANRHGGRPAMHRIALGAISRMVAAIRRERARRSDMRILAELDERLLRDIGICRSDIDGVIRRGW